MDKTQLALLNYGYRKPSHFGPLRQRGKLLVEFAIIDPTPPFVWLVGQIRGYLCKFAQHRGDLVRFRRRV
jgi:hypothetical protein